MQTTNFTECIPGLIAVVGCDGTGKSTLTNDLVKRLQAQWVTERRYLGLLSGEDGDKIKRLPIIGVWLERRLAAKSSKTQSMKSRSPALWAALIMFGFSLRRRVNLRKVRRLARSGVLVVSDRFPQAEISGFYYDGPGIGVERATGKIKTRLARREQRLYQQMARYRPELIIRLVIDVDTAFSRKPDHDYEELRDKIGVMSKIHYNGSHIIELDARAPYSDVLEKALSAASMVALASQRQRVAS
ncbi:nucleoside/nucleotide kinase family protein [Pseudocitrobacter cyperus]|uniref:Thymidylate kinase n=1 Tax=Pseudocitrobacter cyperus TaxID=3112843 RepID=A0ABV0HNP8_9ENTR